MSRTRTVRWLFAISLFVAIAISSGCGPPGDFNTICNRIKSGSTTNALSAWLTEEIKAHSVADSNRPMQIGTQKLPEWVKDFYGPRRPDGDMLYLEKDSRSDHIELVWMNGRGIYGVIVGGPGFKPQLKKKDYFIEECSPGIFVWTPTHFPE